MNNTNIDWNQVRSEFPALERWTYLNTATFGQMPRRAEAAVAAHFAHRAELACADFLEWFTDHDCLRSRIAELVHCAPNDVAFFQNACSALALLVQGIDWREGDEVLTFEHEFPNNIYNTAYLESRGVVKKEVTGPEFYRALSDRTRLVVLSSVNYMSGFRPPLADFLRAAKAAGALVYVDATQSVGALEFEFGKYPADMVAVNCYKWMLTPNGAAFAIIPESTRAWLEPSVIGWRSDQGWREVDHLHHGAPRFKPTAERYEGGMLPSALLYALAANVGLFLELGPAKIEARVLDLAARTRQVMRDLGATLVYDENPEWYNSQIVAARLQGIDASAASKALFERGVIASARRGNLRVSTHFYNNEDDIATLGRELETILRHR